MTDFPPERVMALGHNAASLPSRSVPGQVHTVLYRHGHREREASTVAEAHRAIHDDDGLFAWISMTAPDRDQLAEVARHFDLPELALEDAIVAHQRPKAEVYHGVLFIVLRPAHYDEARESVDFGEVHLFSGHNFAITIRHAQQIDFAAVRDQLEAEPRVLAYGPLAVVHAVMDRIVDAYAPVVASLQEDIDEVENQVFGGAPDASQRTYRLAREVILLSRAVDRLGTVLGDLVRLLTHPGTHLDHPGTAHRPSGALSADPHAADGPAPNHSSATAAVPFRGLTDEQRRVMYNHLRDTADHAAAVRERVDGFRELLQNVMSVDSALIDRAQNEAMKKVSSWGGILVVPTLIASVYGMDIARPGGFDWVFTWPLALVLMALSSLTLYLVFQRNGWL